MGNELKNINNLFGSSDNQNNDEKIENSNDIFEKKEDINLLSEDDLFLIKGFKENYIYNIANIMNKNIIILGDSKIHKTKLFNIIFEKDNLNNNNEHNYAYFEEKNFVIDGYEINLNIWDTPGEESHKEANKHFIKDCIITYLCFHFKSQKSFDSIKNYYIKTVKEINGNNCLIILVGIKDEMFGDEDNSDNIPINNIKKYAEKQNILFYSVSLNDSNSVRYLFHDSIKKYLLLQTKKTFHKKNI